MKSSRGLGWLVWVGVGGVGETMEATPSASCLICSFWRRRSFLKSLAFRHGGRLASAPTPAPERKERRRGDEHTVLNLSSVMQKIWYCTLKTFPGEKWHDSKRGTYKIFFYTFCFHAAFDVRLNLDVRRLSYFKLLVLMTLKFGAGLECWVLDHVSDGFFPAPLGKWTAMFTLVDPMSKTPVSTESPMEVIFLFPSLDSLYIKSMKRYGLC